MKFYGLNNKTISVDDIAWWLQEKIVDGEIESDQEEEPGDWQELTLYLDGGEPVVDILKLTSGTPQFDEAIEETVRGLLDAPKPILPANAVRWLCQYMKRVQVIYNFSPLAALDSELGWELFDTVWTRVRKEIPGIVYCQGEGFTNEEGSQITYEFTNALSGEVRAAVLSEDGVTWQDFDLDLSSAEDRSSFEQGRLPDKQ